MYESHDRYLVIIAIVGRIISDRTENESIIELKEFNLKLIVSCEFRIGLLVNCVHKEWLEILPMYEEVNVLTANTTFRWSLSRV